MNLALFDFDGTITHKDSFLDFLKSSFPFVVLCKAFFLLIFWLTGYKMGFISNHRAKEKVFNWFFKGYKAEQFIKLGEKYALEKLPELIRESAELKIKEHLKNGDTVVVVTASIEQYIRAYTDQLGVELIATRPEVKNDILSGNFSGRNCYGKEKVNRIKEKYDIKQFSLIFAYGDSKGDKEMLSLAHHQFYKYFK